MSKTILVHLLTAFLAGGCLVQNISPIKAQTAACSTFPTNMEKRSFHGDFVLHNQQAESDSRAILDEFLISDLLEGATGNVSRSTLKYAYVDINQNGLDELVVEEELGGGWSNRYVFSVSQGQIYQVYNSYGYGDIDYSPSRQMLMVTENVKPDYNSSVQFFYSLPKQDGMVLSATVVLDMESHYEKIGNTSRDLSGQEFSAWFSDRSRLNWQKVPALSKTSSKQVFSTKSLEEPAEVDESSSEQNNPDLTDGITGEIYLTGKTGWNQAGDKWWYQYPDGAVPKNSWKEIDGSWYYFGDQGFLLTGWLKDGDSIYYCALDGARQTGWQEIDGSWYFFDENGVMQKDWKQIGDQTFYFGDNGIMRIGWQEIDGNWYAFQDKGQMIRNAWIESEDHQSLQYVDDQGIWTKTKEKKPKVRWLQAVIIAVAIVVPLVLLVLKFFKKKQTNTQ